MQLGPTEASPERPPLPRLQPRRNLVTVLAVVAIVAAIALSAFSLGWAVAPRSPSGTSGPGGLPWNSTTSGGPYYGSPLAFSDPQCVINCNAIVRPVGNTTYLVFNVSSLDVPMVAFQIRVTNLGVDTSLPFQFVIYGGEVASIIHDTSPLNTTWITQSDVPPLAPMPAAGNGTTVTLGLTPKGASTFTAVAGEFFWVALVRSSTAGGGQWVTAGVPILVDF